LSRNKAKAEVKKKAMPAPWKNSKIKRVLTNFHSFDLTFKMRNKVLVGFIIIY
jgi:hypothetical protein